MVGAGVFTTSGFTLQSLGSPAWVVLAWLVAGAIALAGADAYGKLARAMPESGGEYLFLSRAIHPAFGFVAGWISLIAGFSGGIAYAATAFESYLFPETHRPTWISEDAPAIFLIVVTGLLHGVRGRVGVVAQNVVVAIKLGLLVVLLLLAATTLPTHPWGGTSVEGGEGGFPFVAFAQSLVWISFSYLGFNAAVYLTEEAEEPERTVPWALLLGTSTVVVLYLLLNAVFVYANPEAVVGKPDVAALAAQALGGDWFGRLARMTVVIALVTSVFSMMMAAPRVYAKMAADGLLPGVLRFEGDSPRAAIVLQVLLASGLVYWSTLRDLLDYLGLTLSVCAACTVSCLFVPRVRKATTPTPSLVLPGIYVASTLATAGVLAFMKPAQVVGTVLTVATGAIVFIMGRYLPIRPSRQNDRDVPSSE
ncbi:putative amino acid permease YhdG [Planctomycetes bacterium Pan216]|uniref:Putative amino acid permease YhdG n=2 Tax=Kolteria novifilia TaxID=2527975 RepID=A0A518B2K6_9BACT|nr:putative amino acid permease YhdG [Planctomycetes bacterium Pan216]